jgi:hypothetical protein
MYIFGNKTVFFLESDEPTNSRLFSSTRGMAEDGFTWRVSVTGCVTRRSIRSILRQDRGDPGTSKPLNIKSLPANSKALVTGYWAFLFGVSCNALGCLAVYSSRWSDVLFPYGAQLTSRTRCSVLWMNQYLKLVIMKRSSRTPNIRTTSVLDRRCSKWQGI